MKTYSITSSGTRALLIDLDNCPRQIDDLPQAIAGFAQAIACYGGAEPKVHLSLVPLLAPALNEGKLKIIKMEKRGKNAADFGLAFWAGRLTAEMPPETEFLILSQDADLDHVVNLLRSLGRKVERIDGKAQKLEIKRTPAAAPSQPSATSTAKLNMADSVEEYFAKYLQTGRARPTKKTTLLNSIKTHFKKRKEIKPQEVLQGLVERGMVALDGRGRVTYPEISSPEQLLSVASNNNDVSPS